MFPRFLLGWPILLVLLFLLSRCSLFSSGTVENTDKICPTVTGITIRPNDTIPYTDPLILTFSEPVQTPAGLAGNYSYFFQIFPVRDTVFLTGETLTVDIRDSVILPWRRVLAGPGLTSLSLITRDSLDTAHPNLLEPGKQYRFCFGGFPRKTDSLRNIARVFLQDTAGNPLISRQGPDSLLLDSAVGIYPEDIFLSVNGAETLWVLPFDTTILFYTK